MNIQIITTANLQPTVTVAWQLFTFYPRGVQNFENLNQRGSLCRKRKYKFKNSVTSVWILF